MARFTASAQYDDWVGQVAADNVANDHLFSYLRDNRLIRDDQFPVGINIYIGEPWTEPAFFSCSVIVVNASSADEAASLIQSSGGEIPTERIDLDLTHEQFHKLFKRFSVVLAHRSASILNREVSNM